MNNEQQKCFSHLWQKQKLGFDSSRKEADTFRFLITQLQCVKTEDSDFRDDNFLHSKQNELYNGYSKVMDSKDHVDNYAEEILSMNKTQRNESKNWKCGLNVEDLLGFCEKSLPNQEKENAINEEYAKLTKFMKIPNLKESLVYKTSNSFREEVSTQATSSQDSAVACNNEKSSSIGRKYPWEKRKESRQPLQVEQPNTSKPPPSFRSASHQLYLNNQHKQDGGSLQNNYTYGSGKKSLGSRGGVSSKFTPPVRRNEEDTSGSISRVASRTESPYSELMMDDRLKGIDLKMVETIMNEIMDRGPEISWEDIAGLNLAKKTIKEIVIWPLLRPDIFTGLRGPPKGLLLFGPPGTGKTMIGKCIASQSKSTFFSISASSLTSKWVGDGEKMVRAMFAVARCHAPAVIFIDEIDSLLSQRSDTEHESSRRIKTEFLVQLDGATSNNDDRLLLVGATNRPQELDDAARRRLVKRLYIPLPEAEARSQIILNLLKNQKHSLNNEEIDLIVSKADGYSGADMANLCCEAALGPIRDVSFEEMALITLEEVRPISCNDFLNALECIRASVSDRDLSMYIEWNHKYGIAQR